MSHNSELAARLECLAETYRVLGIGHADKDMLQHASDLRAAAQAVREREWRPIAEAPRDAGKWVVGRYRSEWQQKETGYLDIAIEDGYTHYFIVPAPPEVVG